MKTLAEKLTHLHIQYQADLLVKDKPGCETILTEWEGGFIRDNFVKLGERGPGFFSDKVTNLIHKMYDKYFDPV